MHVGHILIRFLHDTFPIYVRFGICPARGQQDICVRLVVNMKPAYFLANTLNIISQITVVVKFKLNKSEVM